jgi:hypothetical protein
MWLYTALQSRAQLTDNQEFEDMRLPPAQCRGQNSASFTLFPALLFFYNYLIISVVEKKMLKNVKKC